MIHCFLFSQDIITETMAIKRIVISYIDCVTNIHKKIIKQKKRAAILGCSIYMINLVIVLA